MPDASVVFTVVHEDAELVVVDKPAGLVVHHGAGHHGGTLVDGLLARFPDLGGLWPRRAGATPTGPGSCTVWTRAPRGSWWWPAPPRPIDR